MRDIPEKEIVQSDKPKFDGHVAEQEVILELPKLRNPVKLEPTNWHNTYKYYNGEHRKRPMRLLKPFGASGPDDTDNLVPEVRLREMTDPIPMEIRKEYNNLGTTDPVIAPALSFRIGAHFENGFHLRLKLASQINPETGEQLTQDEIKNILSQTQGMEVYRKALVQLSTWKDDLEIVKVAKDMEGVALVQGKSACLIYPPIMDLAPNKLPTMVEIITAEDLGNPIIDIGSTRKLVACKLELEDKKIAREDELIYYVKGIRGLRREAKFHGIPIFEPILQISKAIKRYYNLDAPLAMINAYITRELIKVKSEGDADELNSRIKEFMINLFKPTTWAISMPEWYNGVDVIQPKVDWAMFDGIEQKLANVVLAILGTPKSAMNREHGLTRDLATIEAIQFVRFTRNPAENDQKDVLENQLFNRLLAHLVGKPLGEIPVRIEIVRNVSESGDIDVAFDNLSSQKNQDINTGNLFQNQAKANPFGASGTNSKYQVTENKNGYIVEVLSD